MLATAPRLSPPANKARGHGQRKAGPRVSAPIHRETISSTEVRRSYQFLSMVRPDESSFYCLSGAIAAESALPSCWTPGKRKFAIGRSRGACWQLG